MFYQLYSSVFAKFETSEIRPLVGLLEQQMLSKDGILTFNVFQRSSLKYVESCKQPAQRRFSAKIGT